MLRCSRLYRLNLLHHMPKLVWDARETRDAQESDGYAVMIQRCSVSFWIESEWRTILANYWAWVFVVREQEPWGDVNGLGVWVPKVILSPASGLILY